MRTPAGVLITRPIDDAMATAARVGQLGFLPVIAPLLAIRQKGIRLPPRCDAVLVASGNALAALPASLRAVPLFAVGDATASRARDAGFGTVLSAGGDADALAALAIQTVPPDAQILLACGAGQGASLAAALRRAGLRVHRRIAYAARPVTECPHTIITGLDAGVLLAALFLSAATAATFARLLPASSYPALARVEALAIGEMAANALRPLPWRRVRVSAVPTLDGVLALL